MNRYYGWQHGRFLTPDPYQASAGLTDPGSWNRYAYVLGDPVNGKDPHGLAMLATDCMYVDGVEHCHAGGWVMWYELGAFIARLNDREGGDASWLAYPNIGSGSAQGGSVGRSEIGSKRRLVIFPGQTAARNALASEECARSLGAQNTSDALSRFDKLSFEFADLGKFMVTQLPIGTKIDEVRNKAPLAEQSGNVIRVNHNVNWFSPDSAHAVEGSTGETTVFNLLGALASELGVSVLTVGQFQTLVLLHEVGHAFGKPQERDAEYNRMIFRDCL